MNNPDNLIALNLLEATVTIYPQDNSGAPILTAPIWSGAQGEHLTVMERWLKAQTKPTGARYPKTHPLLPQYEIQLGRLWVLALNLLSGFKTQNGRYVLDILWNHEEELGWHRWVFYGVTISERNLASQDVDGGFTDDQTFDAEYYVPTAGTGTPPAITSTLPYLVRYVSEGENSVLYTYDFNARTFTGVEDTTGRAVLATDGSSNFSITFAGHAYPALQIAAGDGITKVIALETGSARAQDLPRLDFFLGPTRLASVTERGKLIASDFVEADGLELHEGFLIGAGPALRLAAGGAQFLSVTEFAPTDVANLSAWHRADSLTQSDGAAVAPWPDDSGNNLTLTPTGSPTIELTDGIWAVQIRDGDRLTGANLNSGTVNWFIVAQRQEAQLNRVLAGVGRQSDTAHILLRSGPKPSSDLNGTALAGTAFDENKWSIYELQKTPTAATLRLNGIDCGTASLSSFGAALPLYLGGAPAENSWNGRLAESLLFTRNLSNAEKDAIRTWLRAIHNLP